MRLSAHFDLSEFLHSDTAERLGIDNAPDDAEIANLKRLCEEVLEPLRERIGPIQITSGFRCIALNRAIGSRDSSHHIDGRAADIKVKGLGPKTICEAIAALELPAEQIIRESSWTHVSIPVAGKEPKRQHLTIDSHGVRQGFH